jgi:hypothetical protein
VSAVLHWVVAWLRKKPQNVWLLGKQLKLVHATLR